MQKIISLIKKLFRREPRVRSSNTCVGDVFISLKTQKVWTIVYKIQDDLGDYHWIVRDDTGRVRAVRDWDLDDDLLEFGTKKVVKKVRKDTYALDERTENLISAYLQKKREEEIKRWFYVGIVHSDGTPASRRRIRPCPHCGSSDAAEYLYGGREAYLEEWLNYHLEKGDFVLADETKNKNEHIFHCKNCGSDYKPPSY